MLACSLVSESEEEQKASPEPIEVRVRHLHRRDLNRAWEFLKHVFRDVNRETVEYQRPRSKHRFFDVYDDQDVEQLVFEADGEIVGYAECTAEISGSDNWLNPRYFDKRGMRPMFVDELAVHPKMQGRGVGRFMLEQLQHLARSRGCTHLVLEVAENNRDALSFYKRRNFYRLDAAIFMAQKVVTEPELLPPRMVGAKEGDDARDGDSMPASTVAESRARKRPAKAPRSPRKPRGGGDDEPDE
jgi:ribosomal protein S18 acetylase RimI-like enzyme